MPTLILMLWTVLLALVVALLPFIVAGLHRAWKAARGIDRYFGEMFTAAAGIAGNTQEIPRLDGTIETATRMLRTAGGIRQKAETIRTTLAGRVGGPQP